MGLGSGRALLEFPDSIETFDVRPLAPDVALLANLGAVQLNKGYGVAECRRLVEILHADAIALHLNPLQEALQPEGDTCFSGLLDRIANLCDRAGFPIVVKEVGWGIGADAVRALFDAGVAAVDLAGAGGTSWSEVERYRIGEPWRARVAGAFASWGIPTARALVDARAVAPSETLIASGGIRPGLDVPKALALGADLVGIAGPFLRAADESLEAAHELARELVETLRVAMFCVGARTPADLRGTLLASRLIARRPMTLNLEAADAYCRMLTRRHYENFSVASRFVDASTRRDLMRIYAYCRTTDDLGDESPNGTALPRLERWRSEVEALFRGTPPIHPVLFALRATVEHRAIGAQPFLDLIAANVQDQHVTHYRTWDELIGYCRLSAAPVGRMVLRIFGVNDAHAVHLSDDVCIGLQLANHAQDVSRDAAIGRRYLVDNDVDEGE